MKVEWKKIMRLKGKGIAELLGNRFIILKNENENLLEIMCTELFMRWCVISEEDFKVVEYGFYRFDWSENEMGESILLFHEQITPEPLKYHFTDDPRLPISVEESSYSPTSRIIKDISGYGFFNEGEEFLYMILLETDKEFIYIEGSPGLMEIRISEHKLQIPENLRIMFTTNM